MELTVIPLACLLSLSYSMVVSNIPNESLYSPQLIERTFNFGPTSVTIRRPRNAQPDLRGVLGFPNLFGLSSKILTQL